MADVSSKPLFTPLVFIPNSSTCCLSFALCSHSPGPVPHTTVYRLPIPSFLNMSVLLWILWAFSSWCILFFLPSCSFHLHFLRPSWRTTHHLIRGFCYTSRCSSFWFVYVTSLLPSEPHLSPYPSFPSLSSSCFLLIYTNELTVTASKSATFWIPRSNLT